MACSVILRHRESMGLGAETESSERPELTLRDIALHGQKSPSF